MNDIKAVVYVVRDFDDVVRDNALDAEDIRAIGRLSRREEECTERR